MPAWTEEQLASVRVTSSNYLRESLTDASMLRWAFTWSESPQGHAYWRAIFNIKGALPPEAADFINALIEYHKDRIQWIAIGFDLYYAIISLHDTQYASDIIYGDDANPLRHVRREGTHTAESIQYLNDMIGRYLVEAYADTVILEFLGKHKGSNPYWPVDHQKYFDFANKYISGYEYRSSAFCPELDMSEGIDKLRISMFTSYADKVRGKRTSLKLGKALAKLRPEWGSDEITRRVASIKERIAAAHAPRYVKCGTARADFLHAYTHEEAPSLDPSITSGNGHLGKSCMRWPASHWGLQAHPAEVYASGDFTMYWVEDDRGRIDARCILHNDSGTYSKVYIQSTFGGELLEKHLADQGYRYAREGDWNGAKLLRIRTRPRARSYIVPYVDGSAVHLTENFTLTATMSESVCYTHDMYNAHFSAASNLFSNSKKVQVEETTEEHQDPVIQVVSNRFRLSLREHQPMTIPPGIIWITR